MGLSHSISSSTLSRSSKDGKFLKMAQSKGVFPLLSRRDSTGQLACCLIKKLTTGEHMRGETIAQWKGSRPTVLHEVFEKGTLAVSGVDATS